MKSVGMLILVAAVTFGYTQAPDTLWTKTYGGTEHDGGLCVAQTTDDGYIIAGYTHSYGAGFQDVYLVKTDAFGDTLWTKTYGGSNWDGGNSVAQTTDGGYILAGWTYSYGPVGQDFWLIKTDGSGNTIWTKTYGEADIYDWGSSVAQTTDGGYIITGATEQYGAGGRDVWLLKTDASGDTLWTKIYGTAGSDYGSCVVQTTDGGYIIAGRCSIDDNFWDVWLLKTDASGDTLWTKTYGGATHDWATSVAQTTDGGYIITGTKNGYIEQGDVYLIKTDPSGDTLWTTTFVGTAWSCGNSVAQTTDGGYIITGNHDYDLYIIRTDATGDTLWTKIFEGADSDVGFSVIQTTDGGYVVTGHTRSYGAGGEDVWLIKIEPDVGVEENEPSIVTNKEITTTIFRGPLQLPSDKKCKVFDIAGRVVELDRIQPGIYFIEIDGVVTQKVIKIK